jgi:putative PIN family toxin of toxin-antitoxin system
VRVVLDTNVFVSGVFFSGPPYQILKAWRDDRFRLVVSPDILKEYRRVGEILAKEHPSVDLEPALAYVTQNAILLSAPALPERVCEDPDDDKFIACALAAGNAIIVSGDRHLLKVSGVQNIEILTPREFVDRVLENLG